MIYAKKKTFIDEDEMKKQKRKRKNSYNYIKRERESNPFQISLHVNNLSSFMTHSTKQYEPYYHST